MNNSLKIKNNDKIFFLTLKKKYILISYNIKKKLKLFLNYFFKFLYILFGLIFFNLFFFFFSNLSSFSFLKI
jgi:hypothetical protein